MEKQRPGLKPGIIGFLPRPSRAAFPRMRAWELSRDCSLVMREWEFSRDCSAIVRESDTLVILCLIQDAVLNKATRFAGMIISHVVLR
jgi:hypothetical protein